MVSLMIFELTFGRCENSKQVTCNLLGFLSSKKWLWVIFLKQLHRKPWNDVFWILNKKWSIKFSGFGVVILGCREIPRRPSDPSSSHPKKNMFLLFTCSFSGIRLDGLYFKKKSFDCYIFRKVSKKTLFPTFLVKPFWIGGTQTFIFTEENPGRKHVIICEFCQRSKVSSTITVTEENMENDFPYVVGD